MSKAAVVTPSVLLLFDIVLLLFLAGYLLVLLAFVQCARAKEEAKTEDATAADADAAKEGEEEAKPPTRCMELSDETFNKNMVENGPLFVKFYLPT